MFCHSPKYFNSIVLFYRKIYSDVKEVNNDSCCKNHIYFSILVLIMVRYIEFVSFDLFVGNDQELQKLISKFVHFILEL